MFLFLKIAIFLLLLNSIILSAWGQDTRSLTEEPKYCEPRHFNQLLIGQEDSNKLQRLKIFRLGDVVLTGLGIGKSDVNTVGALAIEHSSATETQKYCTWYYNRKWFNRDAMVTFNHRYVSHPKYFFSIDDAIEQYMERVSPHFFADQTSYLSCAENHGYISIGCNGMKHRGPTVFGMLLAFSGCSPENATKIVNENWRLNGVPASTRHAIIAAAHEYGKENPDESNRLRRLFSSGSE